ASLCGGSKYWGCSRKPREPAHPPSPTALKSPPIWLSFRAYAQSGSKVSRYERFAREPGFATALAYEAIFQVSVSELFPGMYHRIEAGVRARAKKLMGRKSNGKSTRSFVRRYQTLAAIACIDSYKLLKPE
ncbi:MAG: hypothetical protein ACLQVW_28955, partial [Limisphaerales bacterium]